MEKLQLIDKISNNLIDVALKIKALKNKEKLERFDLNIIRADIYNALIYLTIYEDANS